jgi:hypothetical protein
MDAWYGTTCSFDENQYHQFLAALFGPDADRHLTSCWHKAGPPTAKSRPLEAGNRFMLVRDHNGLWPCPFCGEPSAGRDVALLQHIRKCGAADSHPTRRVDFADRLWWIIFGVLPPQKYWIEYIDHDQTEQHRGITAWIQPKRRRVYLPRDLPEPDREAAAVAAEKQLRQSPKDCTVEVLWPTGRPLHAFC